MINPSESYSTDRQTKGKEETQLELHYDTYNHRQNMDLCFHEYLWVVEA